MRKVRILKQEYNPELKKYVPVIGAEGEFHQFGSSFAEYENGAVQFSTAIVELPDGTVRNVDVALIQFLDKGETQ